MEVLEDAVRKQNGFYPKVISVDNEPEFTSKALNEWTHRRGVKLSFSRPATPTGNPYIESFDGRLSEECLNQHWFERMEETKQILEKWRMKYNTGRPYSSLANRTPLEHVRYLPGLLAERAMGDASQEPVGRQTERFLEAVRLTS